MKKNYFFLSITFCLLMLFSSSMMAQDTLMVMPGQGTLNAAIDANGGNKIYKLQAGAYYGLNEIIENVDYHLQIVGEKVDIYHGSQLPATLQTGSDAQGAPLARMIDAKGDITLKNLYIMNVDLNGALGARFLRQSDSAAFVVVDNCVIDPVGDTHGIELRGGDNDLWFTNNLVLRHGKNETQRDGQLFRIASGPAPIACDTAWIENNTFLGIGVFFIHAGWTRLNNLINVNHNTFIHHEGEWIASVFTNELYHTNNLMMDISMIPIQDATGVLPGKDPNFFKRQLIMSDSTAGEALPVQRTTYVHYNSLYRTPDWFPVMDMWNDSLKKLGLDTAFFQPLMWDGATPLNYAVDPDLARMGAKEPQIFNFTNNNGDTYSNPNFPKFSYGSMTYGHDPLFKEDSVYDKSKLYAAMGFNVGLRDQLGYPDPTLLTNRILGMKGWWWDPDGDVSINSTWPLFDGSYTDAATLTGSIESMPLGDLNWYPSEKAIWDTISGKVFDYIKAGNTGPYRGATSLEDLDFTKLPSRIYPTIVTESAVIEITLESAEEVEIDLYNPMGQKIVTLNEGVKTAGTHQIVFNRQGLAAGAYLCIIKAGKTGAAHKIIISD